MDPATIIAVGNMVNNLFEKPANTKLIEENSETWQQMIQNGKLQNMFSALADLIGSFNVGGPALSLFIAEIQKDTVKTRTDQMQLFLDILKKEETKTAIYSLGQYLSASLLTIGTLATLAVTINDFKQTLDGTASLLQIASEIDPHIIQGGATPTIPINPDTGNPNIENDPSNPPDDNTNQIGGGGWNGGHTNTTPGGGYQL
jgi:hypothetical protein